MPDLIDPLKAPQAPLPAFSGHPPTHWSKRTYGDPTKDDFRVFLTLMWRHLNLPDPTPLQLSIAHYIQHHGWTAEIDHQVIEAFRGAAKSWITAAWVLFNLHRNQQLKIGVVSGSGKRAVNFVTFCLQLVSTWPLISHLCPRPDQRQSSTAFDVDGTDADQTPSIWSAGITSQIVGYRADIIVGDDVETNTNSQTEAMREKISENVKEFDSIIKPGGQIIFLGTPQTESSIYNLLPDRGFRIQIWPAKYPTGKLQRIYGDRLAKYILYRVRKEPHLMGTSVEPTRFSDAELATRETALGKATFALQFMLDTTLSDADKYPLRLRDMIVMSLDQRRGPDTLSWGNGEHLALRDVPAISLNGDRVYGPASVSESVSPWQAVVGFIDPSGAGKDETTLTIGAALHSYPFILKQEGWTDGFGVETLKSIAKWVVFYRVQVLRIEEDFGQGMLKPLLEPYIREEWEEFRKKVHKGMTDDRIHVSRDETRYGTEIVSERAQKMQKEKRILEVLEPIFLQHRIVMAAEVLKADFLQVQRREGSEYSTNYSLMYQITRLTREKDCLKHDDRVEGLAGVIKMMADLLGLSPKEAASRDEEQRLLEYLEKLEQDEDALRGEGPHRGSLGPGLRSGRQRS